MTLLDHHPVIRRAVRHVLLALVNALVIYLFFRGIDSKDALFKLSMATAYASLLGLVVSLGIGPWNLLRRRPNPVSSYLRRDVGIWAGIVAVLHVVVGLQVHMGGRIWVYFFYPEPHTIPLRHDLFGLTNYAGLAATLILLLLLAISNNRSLRALGPTRWKTWQRWNYAVAILTVLHGMVYQWLEKRQIGFVLLYAAIVLAGALIQFVGYRQLLGSRTFRDKKAG
jgi:sulfoxide reductase heme-binding subunit YedZ